MLLADEEPGLSVMAGFCLLNSSLPSFDTKTHFYLFKNRNKQVRSRITFTVKLKDLVREIKNWTFVSLFLSCRALKCCDQIKTHGPRRSAFLAFVGTQSRSDTRCFKSIKIGFK